MRNEITTWNVKTVIKDCEKVMILFITDTCNKCHFWMTDLEKHIDDLQEDKVQIYIYDAWKDPDACQELNISTAPTLVYYKDWEEAGRLEEVSPFDLVVNLYK